MATLTFPLSIGIPPTQLPLRIQACRAAGTGRPSPGRCSRLGRPRRRLYRRGGDAGNSLERLAVCGVGGFHYAGEETLAGKVSEAAFRLAMNSRQGFYSDMLLRHIIRLEWY